MNRTHNPEQTREDFATMLDETFNNETVSEGSVVVGKIVAIQNDFATVDVGLKMEGRIALKEFISPGSEEAVSVGDKVEVYLERYENAMGEAVLSRDRARREESWTKLERVFAAGEKVNGVIFNTVKGGFTVDLDGAIAFLPRSQVDIRPVRDVGPLMNKSEPFLILKMDRRRGNIVVSRRSVLEETRAEQRSELVQNLKESQIIEGVVKNITDYGAFVDLGGVDGLLHVTDMSWQRINHPSEMINVGETVKVQVIRINSETHRISLGMKQLETDPWEQVSTMFIQNNRYKGRVTNIADYGAFVEIAPGIEGLIHVSEMSWTKKNVHPSKVVSTSQEVEVMVLDVDGQKRRISLGLKQCINNPWETFEQEHPIGSIIEGEVKNKTEFGIFVGIGTDIDGMVHLSDIDWTVPGEIALENYNKGDSVRAVVRDINVTKERISLSIKHLIEDPMDNEQSKELKRGSVVTCEVIEVKEGGIDVKIVDSDVTCFIRRSDLARDRAEQRPERFSIGEKVDARITTFDKKSRKVSVSVKALEIQEEKEAVAQYGTTDSGASLGDILGVALQQQAQDEAPEEEAGAETKAAEADEKKPKKATATKPKKTKAGDNESPDVSDTGDNGESAEASEASSAADSDTKAASDKGDTV